MTFLGKLMNQTIDQTIYTTKIKQSVSEQLQQPLEKKNEKKKKKKMLPLQQQEEILAEETHKCSCLCDKKTKS